MFLGEIFTSLYSLQRHSHNNLSLSLHLLEHLILIRFLFLWLNLIPFNLIKLLFSCLLNPVCLILLLNHLDHFLLLFFYFFLSIFKHTFDLLFLFIISGFVKCLLQRHNLTLSFFDIHGNFVDHFFGLSKLLFTNAFLLDGGKLRVRTCRGLAHALIVSTNLFIFINLMLSIFDHFRTSSFLKGAFSFFQSMQSLV